MRRAHRIGHAAASEIQRLTNENSRLQSLLELRDLEIKNLLAINERNGQRIAWETAAFSRQQAEALFSETMSRERRI